MGARGKGTKDGLPSSAAQGPEGPGAKVGGVVIAVPQKDRQALWVLLVAEVEFGVGLVDTLAGLHVHGVKAHIFTGVLFVVWLRMVCGKALDESVGETFGYDLVQGPPHRGERVVRVVSLDGRHCR